MKKMILLCALISGATQLCIAQAGLKGKCVLKINGSDLQKKSGEIYLSYQLPAEEMKRESAKLINGTAVFTLLLQEPALAIISMSNSDDPKYVDSYFQREDVFSLFVQPGLLTIRTGTTLANSTLTTTAWQLDYQAVKVQEKSANVEMGAIAVEREKRMLDRDTVLANKKSEEIAAVKQSLVNFYKVYSLRHPQSVVSIYALQQYFSYGRDVYDPASIQRAHTTDSLFSILDPALKALPSAKALKRQIDILKKLAIGQVSPDFAAKDTAGKPHSLSSLRGKYVLIDFWASWCLPCRAQFPDLKKIYAVYSSKNFEILGVALDERKRWQQAIEKEQTPWLQVLDTSSDNSAAILYHISPIPMNYLIDPNGIIIASDLSPEQLKQKLDELIR